VDARDTYLDRLRFRRLRAGDMRQRAALTERYTGLAIDLALRYRHGSEPLDDLKQVALTALVKAIDRFDPDRGVSFSTFAVPTILGELRRHFRDNTWSIHVPRKLQERSARVGLVTATLTTRLGRVPTAGELADSMGITREELLEARLVSDLYRSVSLAQPVSCASDDEALSIGDTLGAEDEELERAEERALLAPLLRELEPRDREMLRLRFDEDMTQREIGGRLGVTQMHVSRLLRGAIERMTNTVSQQAAADL
jgi:RNA polymerase sigma-B factor